MANETNNINANSRAIDALSQGSAQTEKNNKGAAKADEMGKEEFLTLLINQLQNQDPLNPMDGQQFASQLAQFSQLEQLISINENVSASGANSASSMASFLGQEVVLKDATASIEKGDGPNLLVDMPTGIQSARIDFIGAEGGVKYSLGIGDLEAGKKVLRLEDLQIPDGDYSFRVVGVNEQGMFKDLEHKVTGTVEGFVMEPEPMLLVNGKQIPIDGISEVMQGVGV